MDSIDRLNIMFHALTQAMDEMLNEETLSHIYKRAWELIDNPKDIINIKEFQNDFN